MKPETVDQVLALLEQRPMDAGLFQELGCRYLDVGNRKEARAAFQRSIAIEPNDAFTYLFFGVCFEMGGKLREALAQYKHAAELMPDEPIAYICQADIYARFGKCDLAEAAYKKATELNPDYAHANRKLSDWFQAKYGQDRILNRKKRRVDWETQYLKNKKRGTKKTR